MGTAMYTKNSSEPIWSNLIALRKSSHCPIELRIGESRTPRLAASVARGVPNWDRAGARGAAAMAGRGGAPPSYLGMLQ